MNKKCSLCGNIYKNKVFHGGFVCQDCMDYIKNLDLGFCVCETAAEFNINKQKRK